jgi:hypothetical protein
VAFAVGIAAQRARPVAGGVCTADVHTDGVALWQGGAVPGWIEPIELTEQDVAEEVSELCAQLRAARRASGLSVRGIAAAAVVAPFTVTRVEAGSVTPNFATFAKLAHTSGHERTRGRSPPHTLGLGRNRFEDPVVAPGWFPGRGPWWKSDGSDRPMWLQLRAVGSELVLDSCTTEVLAKNAFHASLEAPRDSPSGSGTLRAVRRATAPPSWMPHPSNSGCSERWDWLVRPEVTVWCQVANPLGHVQRLCSPSVARHSGTMTETMVRPEMARSVSARVLVSVVTELGLRLVTPNSPGWKDVGTPELHEFSRGLLAHVIGDKPTPPNCPLCSLELRPTGGGDGYVCQKGHRWPPD